MRETVLGVAVVTLILGVAIGRATERARRSFKDCDPEIERAPADRLLRRKRAVVAEVVPQSTGGRPSTRSGQPRGRTSRLISVPMAHSSELPWSRGSSSASAMRPILYDFHTLYATGRIEIPGMNDVSVTGQPALATAAAVGGQSNSSPRKPPRLLRLPWPCCPYIGYSSES
jgi:hypothetical protein